MPSGEYLNKKKKMQEGAFEILLSGNMISLAEINFFLRLMYQYDTILFIYL